ncbi:MAG: polyprenyl diphosphate synthase [Atribacterota bacterium]|nr:polyprenyl diphosphate synthase [Atribacterota bacterium]
MIKYNYFDNTKEKQNISNIRHLAIIMDGNRRWAKKRNLPSFIGHKAGLNTIKMVIEESIKSDIEILTLYAFSTENWKRSSKEVNSLMDIFYESIIREEDNLIKNSIKVKFIGIRDNLSKKLINAMVDLEKKTSENIKLILNIAINYGGRNEICNAVKIICKKYSQMSLDESLSEIDRLNENIIEKHLFTTGIPDPDLLIRTGGEKRISNFLLWQLAYTELWFTDTYWPDFNSEEFHNSIKDYEKRVRKFGGAI